MNIRETENKWYTKQKKETKKSSDRRWAKQIITRKTRYFQIFWPLLFLYRLSCVLIMFTRPHAPSWLSLLRLCHRRLFVLLEFSDICSLYFLLLCFPDLHRLYAFWCLPSFSVFAISTVMVVVSWVYIIWTYEYTHYTQFGNAGYDWYTSQSGKLTKPHYVYFSILPFYRCTTINHFTLE